MSNIPTAEEFIDECVPKTCVVLPEWLIEFAKFHVEAALKAASEKARQIEDPHAYTGNTGSEWPADYIIDKDSILNAYPLTNIK